MKILSAADFHSKNDRIERFIELAHELRPDLVVLAGDFTNKKSIETLIRVVDTKFLLSKGNMDFFDFDSLGENVHDLAEGDFEMDDYRFCTFPCECVKGNKTDDEKLIVVSHYPPYGILDNTTWEHIGSTQGRKIIEECKPAYYICGHSHENRGVERVGKTTVVNCSIGISGRGTLIDLKTGKIKMF